MATQQEGVGASGGGRGPERQRRPPSQEPVKGDNMSYKPILFNTKMVQAIKEGRKTQTRRIIKLTPGFSGRQVGESGNPDNPLGFMYPCGIKRPPCNKGDILWVRETWQNVYTMDDNDQPLEGTCRYIYYADNTMPFDYWVDKDTGEHKEQMPWRPSIHMPKEAARIFLRVKDVRVERLKDIYEKYEPGPGHPVSLEGFHYTCDFIATWENTIKPADRDWYGWNANPWVWLIEFERCERPADFL